MRISLISMNRFVGSLGLRSISSSLKAKGHIVQMIFLIPLESCDYDSRFSLKILQELTELVKGSDIIGISSMTNESKQTIQIINYLKKLNKPIVWGGIHATSSPDECIKYADMVCIGEGEEAFCELVDAMEKKLYYFDTENFWFKKNEQIIKNPIRHLIKDLNFLPFPDYELDSQYVLDNDAIVKASSSVKSACIHTIRGCPHACTYCCNSFLREIYRGKGQIIRKMNVETIVKQLKQLKDKFPNLNFVWFTDDTMFIRTTQELKLFAKEYKKAIDLPFECYTTPSTMDEEKLKVLLNAGLCKLEMGIQTGSETTNKDIYNRNITNCVFRNLYPVIPVSRPHLFR